MIYLASEFRTLAKISQVRTKLISNANNYTRFTSMYESQKYILDSILYRIHLSAENGSMRIYLNADDPFWKAPELQKFFVQNGFSVDENSIQWTEMK